MRVLLQRVSRGAVTVEGQITGAIDQGLVLLVGMTSSDSEPVVEQMAAKVANLRVFSDPDGKFNHSLLDVEGGVLVVSQFTLYADTRKGRRPSFIDAAHPDHAEPLISHFVQCLKGLGINPVETGVFGASMKVDICNEGPVTLLLESKN